MKKVGMAIILGVAFCFGIFYTTTFQNSRQVEVEKKTSSLEISSQASQNPVMATIPTAAQQKKKPTICLNMIVKDESPVIRRCLQSVKHIIDYWVIVDTGSSDGTQQIIKDFLCDIPGELHEKPWKNFEHNRNEALNFAKNKADYLLFIDADEVLEFASDFQLPHLDKDAYLVTTSMGGMKYGRLQFVNNHIRWNWVGVLHEVLVSPDEKSRETLTGVFNIPRPDGNRSQDPRKFHKDAAVLEAALLENPNHARNVFYLAQSYRDAGELEKALEAYERRVALQGWDQEVFWAMLQIGILKETLKRPPEEVIASYKAAYAYRPSRAEPLYRLAFYYRSLNRFAEAYEASHLGLSVKKSDDILFLEDWIYEYGMILEYAVAAYWEGHYLESLLATKLMLTNPALPENFRQCGNANLGFINTKLEERTAQGF